LALAWSEQDFEIAFLSVAAGALAAGAAEGAGAGVDVCAIAVPVPMTKDNIATLMTNFIV
jgi:hypothetical protein